MYESVKSFDVSYLSQEWMSKSIRCRHSVFGDFSEKTADEIFGLFREVARVDRIGVLYFFEGLGFA